MSMIITVGHSSPETINILIPIEVIYFLFEVLVVYAERVNLLNFLINDSPNIVTHQSEMIKIRKY